MQALEGGGEEQPGGNCARVQLTLDHDYEKIIGKSEVQAFAFRRSLANDVSACLSIEPDRVHIIDLQPGSIKATVEIAEAGPGQPPAEICALALVAQAADTSSLLRQRVPSVSSACLLDDAWLPNQISPLSRPSSQIPDTRDQGRHMTKGPENAPVHYESVGPADAKPGMDSRGSPMQTGGAIMVEEPDQRADEVAQLSQKLRQVLQAEMRSRGLTGLDLEFEWDKGSERDAVGPETNVVNATAPQEVIEALASKMPEHTKEDAEKQDNGRSGHSDSMAEQLKREKERAESLELELKKMQDEMNAEEEAETRDNGQSGHSNTIAEQLKRERGRAESMELELKKMREEMNARTSESVGPSIASGASASGAASTAARSFGSGESVSGTTPAGQDGAPAEIHASKILALEHALSNDLSIASPFASQASPGLSCDATHDPRLPSTSSAADGHILAQSVDQSNVENLDHTRQKDEKDAQLQWQISLSDSQTSDDFSEGEAFPNEMPSVRASQTSNVDATSFHPAAAAFDGASGGDERREVSSSGPKKKVKPSLRLGGVRESLTADPAAQMSNMEWQAKADPISESRRVKWAQYGLERDAALLFAALREKWGSVSAGFNSMVQLKDRRDFDYTRAEYGSFTEKELTAHIMKTTINKHDWLAGVRAICIESNISQKTAGEIFDVLDSRQQKQITHAQLYAGYKGAGMLSCGGGGIPLSLKLKGINKKKGSKLTRFHHLPTDADKVPEHRRRKVRSLGETLDWHDRVQPCGAATYQSIGMHNGRGWEISNTEMATRSQESGTPLVTPRTISTPRSSRPSSVVATPRSVVATPRDENTHGTSNLMPGHGTRFSAASFLPEYSAYGKEGGAQAPKNSDDWGRATNAAADDDSATEQGQHFQKLKQKSIQGSGVEQAECMIDEAGASAAAGVLLLALTALRLKEGSSEVDEGNNVIMSAALTSACRHIEKAHGSIPDWFERAASDVAGAELDPVALTREGFSRQLGRLGIGHMINLGEAEYAFLAADLHRTGKVQSQQLEKSLRSHAVEHTAVLLLRNR